MVFTETKEGTALHIACQQGSVACVHFLVKEIKNTWLRQKLKGEKSPVSGACRTTQEHVQWSASAGKAGFASARPGNVYKNCFQLGQM